MQPKKRNKNTTNTLPVDTGWAWVILAAGVANEFLVIGILRTFGLLMVEFLDVYEQSFAVTSFVTGLAFGLYSLMTLVVLTGGQFMSSRQCVITGGVLSTISFVLSSFAKDIYFLIFSFSILFGIGAGFVTGPTFIILGKYFKKKRVTVNIVVMVAGSCGGVVFPPLAQHLTEEYSVKGALIVLGGFLMNLLVSGALMRPIEFYKPKKKEHKHDSVLKPLINENMDGLPPRSYSHSDSTFSPLARRAMLYRMRSRTESESSHPVPHSIDDDALLSINKKSSDSPKLSDKFLESLEEAKVTKIETAMYSCQVDIINVAILELKLARKKPNSNTKEKDKLSKILENGYSKDDISVKSSSKSAKEDSCFSCFKILFKSNLLKNRTFCVHLCVTFLGVLGIIYPVIYIPMYASDVGFETQYLALLIVLICLSECICRIIIGLLADKAFMKNSVLIVISLVVTGIMNTLAMFYTQYWSLVLFSVIYGTFGGMVLTVYIGQFYKAVGLQSYRHGFPFIMLVQGLIQMIVFPILGLLRDVTGTYETTFQIIGALLLISGVLYTIETLISFIKNKRKLDSSKSDSELSEINVPVVYTSRRRRSSI